MNLTKIEKATHLTFTFRILHCLPPCTFLPKSPCQHSTCYSNPPDRSCASFLLDPGSASFLLDPFVTWVAWLRSHYAPWGQGSNCIKSPSLHSSKDLPESLVHNGCSVRLMIWLILFGCVTYVSLPASLWTWSEGWTWKHQNGFIRGYSSGIWALKEGSRDTSFWELCGKIQLTEKFWTLLVFWLSGPKGLSGIILWCLEG